MWLYKEKVIEKLEDFPENTFGFVYMVTHNPTGISYIGKKVLYHNTNKKLGKKELAALPTTKGRKPTTKKVTKESDWKTYYGSAKPIVDMIKDGKANEFIREILYIVDNKKMLSYYETKMLFTFGVLEHPLEWFNDNIEGRYFRKDFQ
jgi:hypothetical protein